MIGASAAYDDENVYFKIRYVSPVRFGVWIRFPSNNDVYPNERYTSPTQIGMNTLIFKFSKTELLN